MVPGQGPTLGPLHVPKLWRVIIASFVQTADPLLPTSQEITIFSLPREDVAA